MPKFRVIITEEVEHAIELEAESSRDAQNKAHDIFCENEDCFTPINFEITDIEVIPVK